MDSQTSMTPIPPTETRPSKQTTSSPLEPFPTFVHAPLDLTRGHIRLMTLSYEDPSLHSMISLKLRHVDVGKCFVLKYDALSYTWGPPEPRQQILINGESYYVRQNLWYFLREAKRRQYTGKLWVDQICIAQSNVAERNHQVTMMGQIFRTAASVIAWLGHHGNKFPAILYKSVLQFRPKLEFDDDYQHSSQQRAAVNALCQCEYWTRLWIVQELKNAEKVSLWWRHYAFVPDVLLRILSKRLYPDGSSANVERIRWLLHKPLYHTLPPTSTTLSNILRWTRDSVCEDPRDLIFGVQSILEPGSRLRVDYSKCTEEVFEKAMTILACETYAARYTASCIEEFRALSQGLKAAMMPFEREAANLREKGLEYHFIWILDMLHQDIHGRDRGTWFPPDGIDHRIVKTRHMSERKVPGFFRDQAELFKQKSEEAKEQDRNVRLVLQWLEKSAWSSIDRWTRPYTSRRAPLSYNFRGPYTEHLVLEEDDDRHPLSDILSMPFDLYCQVEDLACSELIGVGGRVRTSFVWGGGLTSIPT